MSEETSPQPAAVSADAITPIDMPKPTGPAPATFKTVADKIDPDFPKPAGNAEVDGRGVPFDPARHLPRKHPKTGVWLPKGGRKPKAQVSPGSSSSPLPAGGSAADVSTPGADQSAGSFIADEKTALPPAESPVGSAAPDAQVEVVDHADDAAEIITRGAQFGAGLVFDDPDAGTVPAGEHKHMTKATAAYIRAKNWQASAGVALFLVFAAWFLKIVNKPGP